MPDGHIVDAAIEELHARGVPADAPAIAARPEHADILVPALLHAIDVEPSRPAISRDDHDMVPLPGLGDRRARD